MAISRPKLPPRKGYVEVEIDGERQYRNAETGVLLKDELPAEPPETDVDLLADAYREGVNEA